MSTRRVQPVAVPAGPEVLALLPALRAATSGSGPALLPHPDGEAPPSALAAGAPLAPEEDDPADPTALVVTTSGSTGRAKGVLLPASALLASASATHDRLGGPGRWLLALPAHHVAGVQVLVRSLVAGVDPVVLDRRGGFDAARFAAAARRLDGPRRYTALVPTQLVRLLDAGGDALAALADLDGVLVGGAATPGPVRERARAAGVRLVTTYGATETCGGCVYDGRPLDGVRVRVSAPADGARILLGGPVLARGYRGGDPGGAFLRDGEGRWFRTGDTGALAREGDRVLLTVAGRVDDVVVTGGLKVAPGPVEAALLQLPGVREAVVVGVEDREWGSRVVAAVVVEEGAAPPSLPQVRAHVAAAVAAHAAPRELLVLPRLPLRGPGKPDRAAIVRLAARTPDPAAGADR